MRDERETLTSIITTLLICIIGVLGMLVSEYLRQPEEPAETTTSTTEPVTVTTAEYTTGTTTETTAETTTATVTEYAPSPRLDEPHTLEDGCVSPAFFRKTGVINGNGYTFTWYSENVLPGGGLNIPGRWSDGNYVRDEDGYIVMAHESLPMGTVIDSPFGEGKIYDRCDTPEVIDVYTSF